MARAENKVMWCLKKAEKEGPKHRGLRTIKPSVIEAEEHVKKALHNLTVMKYLMKGGFNDWAINTSFYAHYHCFLAMLQKFGYESRNQECTFAAVEHLIEQGKIDLDKNDLYAVFATDLRDKLEQPDIVDLREQFQYGTETHYEKQKTNELFEQTKKFIEKTKTILAT